MKDLEKRVAKAIKFFWKTRVTQQRRQGSSTGRRDHGNRTAVTGGAQLDGFIHLIETLLKENGLADVAIHKKRTELPGYFRPTKEWDIVVVVDEQLLASIECKSHIGPSFGNNFNNRVEEALGSATDLLTAYREGAFRPSQKPWLGYLILLEENERSTRPVRVNETHFKVFEEYRGASYVRRYEIFCERLMRERLYDASCLLLSNRKDGLKGKYVEPSEELSFQNFAVSLVSKAMAHAKKSKPTN